MKQRAQHIATVLAFAPVLYGLDILVNALNHGAAPPTEPFSKFLWGLMWEDLR